MNNVYINEEFLSYNHVNITNSLENVLIFMIEKLDNQQIAYQAIAAVKAINIINAFCVVNNIDQISKQNIGISNSSTYVISNVKDRLTKLLDGEVDNYKKLFIKQNYPLTDEEHETIQSLLNKLRDKVESETRLDEKHKARVLKKLNEMQMELNKNMSTFDNMIGKAHDVFKVLKFGREEVVSPLLKDTTDLVKAVNKIESKHSGLPDVENQIEFNEDILDTEVIEKNQIEHKE